LVPLFPELVKAAIYGPGRHELARMFFHIEDVPYYFEDNYGRVWIREKDFE